MAIQCLSKNLLNSSVGNKKSKLAFQRQVGGYHLRCLACSPWEAEGGSILSAILHFSTSLNQELKVVTINY